MISPSPRRWLLRNLDVPQKLLVFVVVLTVAAGYASALANLFDQHSKADGHVAVSLDQFVDVYQKKGLAGLGKDIQDSLGLQDVIKHFHGSGAGVTRLEAALNGSMRNMILDEMAGNEPPTDDIRELAESLRLLLIDWSHLPAALRQQAYDKGLPVNDAGDADLARFRELFDDDGKRKPETKDITVEVAPIVTDTFENYCLRCHAEGSPDSRARQLPLDTLATVERFCAEDRGVALSQLALTTHVHLLGFAVLFAATGYLFSMTSFPWILRLLFVPWTLFFQLVEIACWWLAKPYEWAAYGIFYLGPVVGIGLAIQLLGVTIDLVFRRPDPS